MTQASAIRLYVLAVAALALAAGAVLFGVSTTSGAWDRPWLLVALVALGVLDPLFSVKLGRGVGQAEARGHVEALLVFTALLLPPVSGFVAFAGGVAIGELIVRRGRLKGVFNVAQFAGAAALAFAVIDLSGGGGTEISGRRVLAVLLGALVFIIVNQLLIAGVLVLAAGSTFRRELLGEIRAVATVWLGNSSVGVLAGIAASLHVWALAFAFAAVAALSFSFSGHALAQRDRQRLTDLVEWSWDGIFSVDEQGRVQLWNPAMEKLTGRAAAAAVGRPLVLDLGDPAGGTADAFLGPREAAAAEEGVFSLESVTRRRWIRVSRSPLPDGGHSFIARDITEERETVHALEQSEGRLKLALHAGAMGWWEWDFASGEMRWSESLERLGGLAPGTFGGRYEDYLSMIHPDDRAAMSELTSRILAGERGQFAHRMVRPDGTVRWIEAKGRTVSDSAGQPCGMIGVASDITERKRLESELLHSQKTEAVGALAAGISHDFNNLMSVVIGFSQLALLRLDPDGGARQEVEQIAVAGERAAELARQLLAFSRKEDVSPTRVDLNEIVTGMEQLLAPVLGNRVTLVVEAESQLEAIHADRGQIEQVLMNLAVNARDAMPDGGLLTIRTANVTLDEPRAAEAVVPVGAYVLLAVSDTGIGMDEATRSRIFEPFFTTKERDKGTGLGMSTVRSIVSQCGGGLSLTSEIGAGTTFTIYLPRAQPIDTEETPEPVEHALGGTETILLVDDSEGMRTLQRVALEEYGYTVLEAEDAPDALELAAAHDGTIDLLLTDVVMPQLSGIELAQRLSPTDAEMKVLYVSGHPADELTRYGLRDGTVRLLAKPVTPELLIRMVRETLDDPSPASLPREPALH